ncbi:MAG: hypothetical protein NDI90_02120 [Nitrospira sp. BO4]|jgi:hypothetical protein|nr:hypothetical protein [Nitrospira sp. BO4]
MRLAEPISESGYFWLPEDPDTKWPGTLHISDRGEMKLDVIGPLGEPLDVSLGSGPLKRVVGIIKSSMVTLDNCYNIPRTIHFGGISQSVIKAQFAYIGVGYEPNEAVTFSRLDFSVEGLDEWLSITGLRVEHHWEAQGATIQYGPPTEVPIQLPGNIGLAFTFAWTLPSGVEVTKAEVTQKAYISLRSKDPRPIEDFLSLAFKITNFLCFAIDKTVYVDSVTAYSDELTTEIVEGQKRKIPVTIYYEGILPSEVRPRISWHDMLFQYRHVAQELEKVMTNWLANYEISEPAFNLYFASQSGAHRYIDGSFLSLAQGIETLHRRNSDKILMPESEFTQLVNVLLKACPNDKQKWLSGKLTYGNELSLRHRLTDMIDPFQPLYGSSTEGKAFISKVIDTRNYLTHYDKNLSAKAATGTDLWKLCMKLEVLFQLHFLRLMGLENEYIKHLVNQNYAMKEKLKN